MVSKILIEEILIFALLAILWDQKVKKWPFLAKHQILKNLSLKKI